MVDQEEKRSPVLLVLLVVLLGPPAILFTLMGFNLVGDNAPPNPYKLAFDAEYREQTRKRWQRDRSMWREIGTLAAMVVLASVMLCCYYAVYSWIRYDAVPEWMGRTFCFFAQCDRPRRH